MPAKSRIKKDGKEKSEHVLQKRTSEAVHQRIKESCPEVFIPEKFDIVIDSYVCIVLRISIPSCKGYTKGLEQRIYNKKENQHNCCNIEIIHPAFTLLHYLFSYTVGGFSPPKTKSPNRPSSCSTNSEHLYLTD